MLIFRAVSYLFVLVLFVIGPLSSQWFFIQGFIILRILGGSERSVHIPLLHQVLRTRYESVGSWPFKEVFLFIWHHQQITSFQPPGCRLAPSARPCNGQTLRFLGSDLKASSNTFAEEMTWADGWLISPGTGKWNENGRFVCCCFFGWFLGKSMYPKVWS